MKPGRGVERPVQQRDVGPALAQEPCLLGRAAQDDLDRDRAGFGGVHGEQFRQQSGGYAPTRARPAAREQASPCRYSRRDRGAGCSQGHVTPEVVERVTADLVAGDNQTWEPVTTIAGDRSPGLVCPMIEVDAVFAIASTLSISHVPKRYARWHPQWLPSKTAAVRRPPLNCAYSVELRGFEPLTPSMRTRCATGLRYSPWNESQRSKLCLLLAPPMWWPWSPTAAAPTIARLQAHAGYPGYPSKVSWVSSLTSSRRRPDDHGKDSHRDRRRGAADGRGGPRHQDEEGHRERRSPRGRAAADASQRARQAWRDGRPRGLRRVPRQQAGHRR